MNIDLFMSDESYRFDISISNSRYDHKPTAKDYAHMTFSICNVSLSELIDKITGGYSICHLFKGNHRSKKDFDKTYCVFYDIDNASVPMNCCLDGSSLLPSLAYTTYSDGIKGYRYRFIYVFADAIQSEEDYISIYSTIKRENGFDLKDNCGCVTTQLMNGNSSTNVQTFISNYIYKTNHFLQTVSSEHLTHPTQHKYSIELICKNNKCTMPTGNPLDMDCNVDNIDFQFAVSDLYDISESEFLLKYQYVADLSESLLVYNDLGYSLLSDDYFRLPVRFTYQRDAYDRPQVRVRRFHDNEQRRKKLYADGCMMRAINPDATAVDLLINLIRRRHFFYDNSDGVISNAVIIDKVMAVMSLDITEIDCQPTHHGRFRISRTYCKEHNLKPRQYARVILKMLHYQEIGEWYDCGKSVATNLRYAKEHNISVSRSTLIRFCNDNGLDTTPGQVPIGSWYNDKQSVKQNIARAQKLGIQVSQSALYYYCRQNGINPKGEV